MLNNNYITESKEASNDRPSEQKNSRHMRSHQDLAQSGDTEKGGSFLSQLKAQSAAALNQNYIIDSRPLDDDRKAVKKERKETPSKKDKSEEESMKVDQPLLYSKQRERKLASLDTKYIVKYAKIGASERYLQRNSKEEVFKDSGTKIRAKAWAAERVAGDVVSLALTKDWKDITVNGRKDFKRKVWIEGSYNDMNVKGYKPTEQDKRVLLKMQQERQDRIETKKQPVSASTPESKYSHTKENADLKAVAKFYAQFISKDKASQEKIEQKIASELDKRERSGVETHINSSVKSQNKARAATPSQEKKVASER